MHVQDSEFVTREIEEDRQRNLRGNYDLAERYNIFLKINLHQPTLSAS